MTRGVLLKVNIDLNSTGGIPITFDPIMHFNYGEFLPACYKFLKPADYIGRFFISTKDKSKVTCPECEEWIHS